MGNYCPVVKHFFQTLAINVFFHPRYPLVVIFVSERTLRVLSEKYNFDRGYPMWKVMSKINETWIYCGFGQLFSLTQAITITRICPQSSHIRNELFSKLLVYYFPIFIGSRANFQAIRTQNQHFFRKFFFGCFFFHIGRKNIRKKIMAFSNCNFLTRKEIDSWHNEVLCDTSS